MDNYTAEIEKLYFEEKEHLLETALAKDSPAMQSSLAASGLTKEDYETHKSDMYDFSSFMSTLEDFNRQAIRKLIAKWGLVILVVATVFTIVFSPLVFPLEANVFRALVFAFLIAIAILIVYLIRWRPLHSLSTLIPRSTVEHVHSMLANDPIPFWIDKNTKADYEKQVKRFMRLCGELAEYYSFWTEKKR